MEAGLPQSVCRCRLQNTHRCYRQKLRYWAYEEKAVKKLSVKCHEAEWKWRTDEASLRLIGTVKTRVLCGRWDRSVRSLIYCAGGCRCWGYRSMVQAHERNRSILCCNANRKIQANICASMKVGMNNTGAEESVVVMKSLSWRWSKGILSSQLLE